MTWKVIARKHSQSYRGWPKQYKKAILDARKRFDKGLTFLAQKRDLGFVILVEKLREEPEKNPIKYFEEEL